MGISCVSQLPFSNEIKEKLRDLVQMILEASVDCTKIVLFGSYARAEQTALSDFDILVLSQMEVPQEVRGELCSKFEQRNSDLIFYRNSDFELSETLLVERIKKEGVLLWKR